MAEPSRDESVAAISRLAIDQYQKHMKESGSDVWSRNQASTVTGMLTSMHGGTGVKAWEAKEISEAAIKAYEKRSRDMPHEQARDAAAKDISAPREAGLDVRNFARSVIDDARANPNQNNRVVLAYATVASDEGRARIDNAAKVATTALVQYSEARKIGMDHDSAREHVAKEVGSRFDERGRDAERSQERPRSRGMGL